MNKRILIVDDSVAIRGSVRAFIESWPGFEVCGEASDGLEGVEKRLELKPDVIILDFPMPRLNGLQVALIVHQTVPTLRIILYTLYKDTIAFETCKAMRAKGRSPTSAIVPPAYVANNNFNRSGISNFHCCIEDVNRAQ